MQVTERLVYIDPEGVKYPLHTPPSRVVLAEEGYGLPPIDYITQRGPLQHGVSVLDAFLQPRSIQVTIRQNFKDRAAYWNGRNSLLDAIRFNKSHTLEPGHLLKYMSNGEKRQIDVLIASGPGFSPKRGGWDENAFTEVLRFTANNPVWYDPTLRSTTFSVANSGSQLSFPATFPIEFNAFGGTVNISYDGTWLEYPTILITGPITSPVIENVTTGESIELDTTIAAGRVVTVDLTYGSKTVTFDDGTNYIGYVSSDSDLDSFHLEPAPDAPGGVNEIRVGGSATSSATAVEIQWYRRFIGV